VTVHFGLFLATEAVDDGAGGASQASVRSAVAGACGVTEAAVRGLTITPTTTAATTTTTTAATTTVTASTADATTTTVTASTGATMTSHMSGEEDVVMSEWFSHAARLAVAFKSSYSWSSPSPSSSSLLLEQQGQQQNRRRLVNGWSVAFDVCGDPTVAGQPDADAFAASLTAALEVTTMNLLYFIGQR